MSQTKTDKPRGTITKDPELAAINKISQMLDGLSQQGCKRVVAYIVDRYVPGGVWAGPFKNAAESVQ